MSAFEDELRHIELICNERRQIERRLSKIETIFVGLVANSGHAAGMENDLRALEQ